ncbi:MAG: hypothetical protein QOH99_1691 [Frankiaceae bacterium]|nr:hypothetical protein [Frankiaceae bacterium]
MTIDGAGRLGRPVPVTWWALAFTQLLVIVAGGISLPGLVHAAHPVAPPPVTAPPSQVATSAPTNTAAVVAGVATTLRARDKALLAHNRAGYLAAARPRSAAAKVAASLITNIALVPLAQWDETVDETTLTAVAKAANTYTVEVIRRYRINGYDPGGVAQRRRLTVARTGSRWLVTADAPAPGARSDLWDAGPVVIRRGKTSLVLAHKADAAHLASYAQIADTAARNVTAVWGTSWARRVVVIVPSTAAELGRVLNSNADYSQIAALATADIVDTAGQRTALADRVVINPATFGRLTLLGQGIVMTHEVTHVASRRATGKASPLWLVEGLADYVAYRHSGVPTRIAARDLVSAARRGPLPATLPADNDFEPAATHLGASYELSWLACRFIAERAGEAKLLAFYKAVGADSGPQDQVVRRQFKVVLASSPETFTASWRTYVAAAIS